MANNVFTLLDNYTDRSIDNTDRVSLQKANKIIRYPPSLAKAQGGIPFTLFMPYKRKSRPRPTLTNANRKEDGSLEDTLFTSFPTPDFAIALPTPTSALKTTYAADYGDVNLGQSAGVYFQDGLKSPNIDGQLSALNLAAAETLALAKGATAAASGVGALMQSFSSVAGKVGGPLLNFAGSMLSSPEGQAAAGAATALALDANFSSVASAYERGQLALGQTALSAIGADEGAAQILKGATTNPFTDRLFKNVQFRAHTFSYTFLPKNEEDSKEIDKIIQLFKYAMLPRPSFNFGGLQAFFEFPYEFQITHSIQATTFTLLPSVLESMETDFGGGTDSLKLFKTTSVGKQYPTKITVSMTFKEMVLLNRDLITGFRNDNFFVSDSGVAPGDTDVKRYRF